MELSSRKEAILSAIINHHIKTGEAVGSKLLCDLLDFEVSSATLRNEMSALCELGYLNQPHTSAGRIPTSLGYRLYVKSLMRPSALSDETKLAIDTMLSRVKRDPENIPAVAGQVLTDLMGLPAISATVADNSARIKRVRLMPMGRHMLLMMVSTSDNITLSRICRSDAPITEGLLNAFYGILENKVIDTELSKFEPAFLQTLVAEAGIVDFDIIPLVCSFFDLINELRESKLNLKGESKLFSNSIDDGDALKIIDSISKKDRILSVIEKISEPISVVFSEEFNIPVKASSMIIARYKFGDSELGRIGVIGPNRMAYEQIIPSLKYFATRLGTLASEALKDMED